MAVPNNLQKRRGTKRVAKKSKKMKRVTFHLASRDATKLCTYARQHKIPISQAAKSLLRQQLQQLEVTKAHKEADNQLNIFDSVQIDIFDQNKKTKSEGKATSQG